MKRRRSAATWTTTPTPQTTATLERLVGEHPKTLACMHGSAWRGDGAALLRALAKCLKNGRTY